MRVEVLDYHTTTPHLILFGGELRIGTTHTKTSTPQAMWSAERPSFVLPYRLPHSEGVCSAKRGLLLSRTFGTALGTQTQPGGEETGKTNSVRKEKGELGMRCGQICSGAAVDVKPAPVDGIVRGAERPTWMLTTAVIQLKRWQQATRSATCSSTRSCTRPRRQPHPRRVVRLGEYRRAEKVAAAIVAAGLGDGAAPRPPILSQQQRGSNSRLPPLLGPVLEPAARRTPT
jgi:hypothetical protein